MFVVRSAGKLARWESEREREHEPWRMTPATEYGPVVGAAPSVVGRHTTDWCVRDSTSSSIHNRSSDSGRSEKVAIAVVCWCVLV